MKPRSSYPAMAFVAGLAAALVGCSGITYNQDYDPDASFTTLKSYSWVEAADPSQVDRGVAPLVARRVNRAIDENLENKGYNKLESGTPDFMVNWYVGTDQKISVSTYSTGWGYYGWYGGTTTQVNQWTEGTLVVDIIDTKSKELIWRGWAKGALSENPSSEEVTRAVNEVISGILQPFPPGDKKQS